MKNLIKIVLVMFIVNVAGIAKTFAQSGTSFLRPSFEYQTDIQTIEDGFREAMQKGFGRGIFTCFERQANETPSGATPVQIIQTIASHLKAESGTASLTGIEVMEMFRNGQVTYQVVGPEYWDTHENAYFTRNGGLAWWDPRGTQVPVLKDRKQWVIATFHFPNGGTADIVANCGNLSRLKLTNTNVGGYQAQPAAAYVAPGINQTQIGYANVNGSNNNVVVNTNANVVPGKKSWFAKHWWIIPVVAVVAGGAAYLAGHHGSSSGSHNTYDNGFQGGSGSSGASGGSGSSQTW